MRRSIDYFTEPSCLSSGIVDILNKGFLSNKSKSHTQTHKKTAVQLFRNLELSTTKNVMEMWGKQDILRFLCFSE
ncbi:dubious [Schizosaccharomyces pombe]|uniref:Putative uncharacterized protein CUNK4.20 n=1 Tax=Schizosaccharomyces pombe (strain 972 / ATCC 24843) TaxID=284812 RepID=YEAK_SCHPO|nr:uncharacterized protein SPACUNK4.20 [Schizosaccharomyces pombe]G2TRL8.1 RecName: Full=Putative uncharacterized protein CUNK4.20 [Schizosaccharomyces pombe 972h-]CCD31323.1 dubious [Schizosaccharomyces pombe]|eukprot:NP_001343113.1 uncharacterized protein SPACUNK4.20 [Schizosaccharomyces pombe]